MATTQIAPMDIRRLEARYSFEDEPAVLHFLGEYPTLVPLLLEAYEQVSTYFPDSIVVLRVLADPVAGDDENQQLMLCIQTALTPAQALAHLSRFDDGWWLDAVPRAARKLGTMLEFANEL